MTSGFLGIFLVIAWMTPDFIFFLLILQVLASGMNLHLSENELIRSIFSLGAPLPSLSEVASNRPSKHERVSKSIFENYIFIVFSRIFPIMK